jgi:hypothetical protein
MDERSLRKKRPIGGEHVHVPVDVRQIRRRSARTRSAWGGGGRLVVRIDEHSRSDAAQLTEPRPMLPKGRTQQSRQGERLLPVRQDRLHAALVDRLKSPQVSQTLLKMGAPPELSSPEQLSVFLRPKIKKFAEVVELAGARID